MERIQSQAARLWQLIFASETAATYQKALGLTWDILRESAQLIWLVLCLVLVLGAWLYDTAVQTGRDLRSWYDQLGQTAEAEDGSVVNSTGKALLEAGQTSAGFLLSQAREQLGIAPPPKPAKAIAAQKPKAASPEPTPAVPATTAPATPAAKAAESEAPEADDE
jgi:hypothetical protein